MNSDSIPTPVPQVEKTDVGVAESAFNGVAAAPLLEEKIVAPEAAVKTRFATFDQVSGVVSPIFDSLVALNNDLGAVKSQIAYLQQTAGQAYSTNQQLVQCLCFLQQEVDALKGSHVQLWNAINGKTLASVPAPPGNSFRSTNSAFDEPVPTDFVRSPTPYAETGVLLSRRAVPLGSITNNEKGGDSKQAVPKKKKQTRKSKKPSKQVVEASPSSKTGTPVVEAAPLPTDAKLATEV